MRAIARGFRVHVCISVRAVRESERMERKSFCLAPGLVRVHYILGFSIYPWRALIVIGPCSLKAPANHFRATRFRTRAR